jgi:hypothetical protein
MGMYSDWVVRNPEASDKQAVNVEFVLREIDMFNNFVISKSGDTINSGTFTFNGAAKVYVETPPLPS